MEYTIRSGDTLGQIARRNNTSVASLASANNISDVNKITAGSTLRIPNITGTVPTPSPVVDIAKITDYTPLQGNLASTAPVVSAPVVSTTPYQDIINSTPVATTNTQGLEAKQTSYLNQIKDAISGTENATASYNDVAGRVAAQNNATEAEKLGYGNVIGGTTVTGRANNDRELDRQNAIKQLGLANELNAAKYKLDVAQNKVDNLKSYLAMNKDELTRLDEKAYKAQQANIVAKEKDLAAQNTLLDGVAKIKQDIITNGGDPSIINGAKSISQAIDMAGTLLKKPNTEVVKLGEKAAYLIDKTTGKIIKSFGGIASGIGGVGGVNSGTYKNDLDALIGNVENTIPTKFGQATFRGSMSKARNDGDKISAVATVLLKNAPAEERKDFVNQTVGMKQLDKAIELLDSGVKTGVLRAGTQYTYNLAGKDFDPNLSKLNQLIISAIQPYRNSVTGAAWGEQEDGEYAQLFGSIKYSPAELKQRLEGVKEIMKDKSVGALRAYADPLSQYGDMFSNAPSSQGKGNTDDHTFVSRAVSNQTIPYETLVNNTPAGQIPVADNKTGQVGYIPINEYSSLIYTKI